MRNHTFKPGDLAIVFRCGNTRYIGMVVKIIERHENPEFDWNVAFLSGPVYGKGVRTAHRGFYSRAAVCNWNLMPLGELVLAETGFNSTEACHG